MKLGVNVDHIATLREARHTPYPDPVVGALLVEYAGADSIVAHLREDARHIKTRDIFLIKEATKIPFNLEMSINRKIVECALALKPYQATLVPERRQELTTEGGIDLAKNYSRVSKVINQLHGVGIMASLFIDPQKNQVDYAKRLGADVVELNTAAFSESRTKLQKKRAVQKIQEIAKYAKKRGFSVAAGHGLHYENVKDIVKIKEIEELNIGHAIICRAAFIGLVAAVEEMRGLMQR